jgi:hypothetical protein
MEIFACWNSKIAEMQPQSKNKIVHYCLKFESFKIKTVNPVSENEKTEFYEFPARSCVLRMCAVKCGK